MKRGRRSVLNWLLGTWSAGVLGAIAFPLLRYLQPPEVPEAPTASVKGGSAASLAPNSARLVPFGSTPTLSVWGDIGAPGRSRTCDPRLRRPMLYPLSYGRVVFIVRRPVPLAPWHL